MEFLTDYTLWASFFTLSILEIVLGIDNVVFIALLANQLPEHQRAKARFVGLSLAFIFRVMMLFGVVWIIGLTQPLFSVFGYPISGKSLMFFLGGLFLFYKAIDGLIEEITGAKKAEIKKLEGGFMLVITQVVLVDLVFSFDAIMVAVGITTSTPVIITAMFLAIVVMLASSKIISEYIEKHPTIRVLALVFILLIAAFLITESFDMGIPKPYIYFGMGVSFLVELINLIIKNRNETVN